jgi:hypothetical protein
MSNAIDRFCELISPKNRLLWSEVRKVFKSALEWLDEMDRDPPDIPELREALTNICPRWRANLFYYVPRAIADELDAVFQRCVIDHIGLPSLCTSHELTAIAISQFTELDWDNDDEIAKGMERFRGFALAELEFAGDGRKCFSLNVGRWPWVPAIDEAPKDDLEIDDLWSSPSGIDLIANAEADRYLGYKVEAYLVGRFTNNAMNVAEDVVQHIIPSIVRTIQLGVTLAEESMGQCPPKNEMIALKRGLAEPDDWDGGSETKAYTRAALYAPLKFLTSGDGRLVLNMSLSAFFSIGNGNQNTLMQRLRNATVLLSHADETPSRPIVLALAFAAIEALVCEKGDVGEQIRNHIPTLLEQDPSKGSAKKRNALYELYDLRSHVLHGSNLSASKQASDIVRRIAAGTIRAICVWKAHWENVRGEQPEWKNLMDELVISSRMKQPMIPTVPNLGELLPDSCPK